MNDGILAAACTGLSAGTLMGAAGITPLAVVVELLAGAKRLGKVFMVWKVPVREFPVHANR